MTSGRSSTPQPLSTRLQWLVPAILVAALLVVFYPVPSEVLDLLLAGNLAISLVLLLTTLYVPSPLDLSMFPTLLLATALGRVILNFGSTRLILTNAPEQGVHAAGGVIQAFGEFVAAGDPVVGFVMFLILVVIQFVVVTKGATRISEVSARFALDGMPGRQMAVDSDLQQGVINGEQAAERRRRIVQETNFYGAMDGAAKFVRGDAVAGLIITAVNILGGLLIGVSRHGMSISEASRVFTVLTVGDGLACQIPAFLVSIAAGLVMTRSSEAVDLPRETMSQLLRHREVYVVAAAFMAALALIGLPPAPLAIMAALATMAACQLPARTSDCGHVSVSAEEPTHAPEPATTVVDPAAAFPSAALQIEPLELELGLGLVRLADRSQNGQLLERVSELRNRIATELGFILPKVRIRDNLRLDPRQYQIALRGVPLATAEAYADGLWTSDDDSAVGTLSGIEATDPITGRRGAWIEAARCDEARQIGVRVEEPSSRIVRHLGHVVRNHADELLTRQHVHDLLENLRQRAPRLVEDLVSHRLTPAAIHRVLGGLLRERVPIRDLETILESIGDQGHHDAAAQIEHARMALRRTICLQYRDEQRWLHAVLLDSELEEDLLDRRDVENPSQSTRKTGLDADQLRPIVESLLRLVHSGRPPVVVCSPLLRPHLRMALAAGLPQVAVLSRTEVTLDTEIRVVATVGRSTASAAALA